MKYLFFLLLFPLFLCTASPQIAFQNSILVQLNGKTISLLDVKKKLDLFFYKTYPQLSFSDPARYQFYQQSWRQVLLEMIDHELILADAADREIKITDGEVREELERRFGPNTFLTLDKIGLTYEEAWKIVKDEMIVQRMSWWFVHMRAMHKVTPEEIRNAYQLYLCEHPPYQEWKYQIITFRGKEAEKTAQEWYALTSQKGGAPDTHSLDSAHLSQILVGKDLELSDLYKEILLSLSPGQYSPPMVKNQVAKIFYCIETSHHPAPSFDTMSNQLRDALTQEAIATESLVYIEKLRRHYGFDLNSLQATLPDDLEPFSLE